MTREKNLTDRERTNELYKAAARRVNADPDLVPFFDTIMADYPEGDEHWQWVIDADREEILSWAGWSKN